MAITCSHDVKCFIADVRRQAIDDTNWRRSNKQCTKLVIQLEKALTHNGEQPDRADYRKAILQAITGQKLLDPNTGKPTQNMLTSRWHHILIEETLDGKSDLIIREIARLIEENPHVAPFDLFPKEW